MLLVFSLLFFLISHGNAASYKMYVWGETFFRLQSIVYNDHYVQFREPASFKALNVTACGRNDSQPVDSEVCDVKYKDFTTSTMTAYYTANWNTTAIKFDDFNSYTVFIAVFKKTYQRLEDLEMDRLPHVFADSKESRYNIARDPEADMEWNKPYNQVKGYFGKVTEEFQHRTSIRQPDLKQTSSIAIRVEVEEIGTVNLYQYVEATTRGSPATQCASTMSHLLKLLVVIDTVRRPPLNCYGCPIPRDRTVDETPHETQQNRDQSQEETQLNRHQSQQNQHQSQDDTQLNRHQSQQNRLQTQQNRHQSQDVTQLNRHQSQDDTQLNRHQSQQNRHQTQQNRHQPQDVTQLNRHQSQDDTQLNRHQSQDDTQLNRHQSQDETQQNRRRGD